MNPSRPVDLQSHTAAEVYRIRALEHALELSNIQMNQTVSGLRAEIQWLRDHPRSGLSVEGDGVPPSYSGRNSTSVDSLHL